VTVRRCEPRRNRFWEKLWQRSVSAGQGPSGPGFHRRVGGSPGVGTGIPRRPLDSSARMTPVARGKRAGAKQKQGFRPVLLLLALGITACVVAWGYLVYAAIDFGGEARDGREEAWTYLGVAAVGAAACLFIGLMLIARLSRAIGLTAPPEPKPPKPPKTPKPPKPAKGSSSSSSHGGRRAAR
jgi:hypothetical protein